MSTYNLTDQPIEDSFQPLLQIDSGSALRDGTGSIVENIIVTASFATTSSYAENVDDPNWNNIQNKPSGLVSGSSQIDYPQISNIPSGIISSSEQLPAGLISSSTQVDELLPSGVVSGSSQVSYVELSNIPSGIVSSSSQVSDLTGSLLTTASLVDATITLTKGDGSSFNIIVDNVQSASYSDNSTSASHAVVADTVLDTNIAYKNVDNNFSGNQTFNDITVNGTGSFANINYVTGSATIIGDAFVVLNTDTPTLRYAGLQVIDSGSGGSASLQWDGDTDRWLIVDEQYNSAYLLSGPTGSIGGETLLTDNKLPKSAVGNQLVDSNISDNGSTITLGSATTISTGNLEFGGTNQIILNPNGIVEAGEVATSNLLTDTIEVNNGTYIAVTSDILSSNSITASFFIGDGSQLTGVVKPSETGSFATLGSNTFVGNQIISGNLDMGPDTAIAAKVLDAQEIATPLFLVDNIEPNTGTAVQFDTNIIISGSVNTEVQPLTITSLQTTIDFNQTSLFELTLGEGVNTEILASNVGKGQTINVLITQNGTTAGTVTFSSAFLQPDGSEYVPTTTLGGQDILTLMTYNDTSKIYVVATNTFV